MQLLQIFANLQVFKKIRIHTKGVCQLEKTKYHFSIYIGKIDRKHHQVPSLYMGGHNNLVYYMHYTI